MAVKYSRPINYEKAIQNGGSILDEHGDRILKWNSHGIVTQITTDVVDANHADGTADCETNEVAVHVRFHDTSVHHNLRMHNQRNCCLADLSRRALALSCSKVLHVQHFDPEFDDTEWSMELPRGEHAKALALGDDFVVLATDKRLLRLFSLEGTQRIPICIPGAVHAVAASGNTVAVVYRRTLALPSTQALELMMLNVSQVRVPTVQQLPFSPMQLPIGVDATLQWIGFSDQGTLATFDSLGSVRMLKNGLGCGWIEISNLNKQASLRTI
jgi:chromosome transmission fidelity protein 4